MRLLVGSTIPILDVEMLLRPGESLDRELAQDLANEAGWVFGTPPGRTWVKARPLGPEQDTESAGGPPQEVYPVFVSVLKASLAPPDRLELEVSELTRAAAVVCHRPSENLHRLYQPAAAGRVSFGGKLVSALQQAAPNQPQSLCVSGAVV
jgi:hypothetical protein